MAKALILKEFFLQFGDFNILLFLKMAKFAIITTISKFAIANKIFFGIIEKEG